MSESIQFFTRDIVKELNKTIIVLDTETTGFSQYKDRIVEFGAIKLIKGQQVDSMSVLINPRMPIPINASKVHGITDDMVENEYPEEYYVPKIEEFLRDAVLLVAHNAPFDMRFLEQTFYRNGREFDYKYLDTLRFAKQYFYQSPNHQLSTLAEYLNINVKNTHRALADVETTVWLLRHLAYQVMKNVNNLK